MGLSRRHFIKEFKLAAIQRLGMGAPVTEVARAFAVNPNTLDQPRHSLQEYRFAVQWKSCEGQSAP